MGKLWINDQLLIDSWLSSNSGEKHSATIQLTAGEKVPIKIDYAYKSVSGGIKLEWESANQPAEVIPTSQLYPNIISGIDTKNEISSLQVYPNPAKNKVFVGHPSITTVEVFNLLGRKVFSKNKQETMLEIDVSEWPNGVNLVKAGDGTIIRTQKLIISK